MRAGHPQRLPVGAEQIRDQRAPVPARRPVRGLPAGVHESAQGLPVELAVARGRAGPGVQPRLRHARGVPALPAVLAPLSARRRLAAAEGAGGHHVREPRVLLPVDGRHVPRRHRGLPVPDGGPAPAGAELGGLGELDLLDRVQLVQHLGEQELRVLVLLGLAQLALQRGDPGLQLAHCGVRSGA